MEGAIGQKKLFESRNIFFLYSSQTQIMAGQREDGAIFFTRQTVETIGLAKLSEPGNTCNPYSSLMQAMAGRSGQ